MKKIIFLMVVLLLIPTRVEAFGSSAEASILMDMDSKKILYANNIHKVKTVASISKIMTAIVAIESGKLQDVVKIGDEILPAYGSAVYIRSGEEMKLEDLLYGLMLRSGNDAALAIAHYAYGSVGDFVVKMNEKAKEIGMKHSVFHNPSGLDEKDGNFSTAYDMAILTSYAMKNADYQKIVSTKKHVVKTNLNVYSWTNKHRLLGSYKYATGGKTGFTEKARRTLVTTASYEGLNLVAVTLNDGDDFADHTNLFKEAFATYESKLVLKAGDIHIKDDKYYEDHNLYLKNEFRYLLKSGENEQIYLKFELEKKRTFTVGEVVGKVYVMMDNEKIYEDDVYVGEKEQSKKFNLWTWFKNLW